MAPERDRMVRRLTDLRNQLRADLERKQHQLEGFEMAMKVVAEAERMEEIERNRAAANG